MMLFSRPFSEPGAMKIALFNEFMSSLYLYTDMLLTDFHGYDTARDHFGSFLVVILGVTVAVNFFRLVWMTLKAVIPSVKRARTCLYVKFRWL
jgi:hypothetical protein